MFFGFLRKRSVTKPSSSGTKTFTSKIKASPSPSSSWESSSASLSLFHHRSHCLGPTRELFCLPSQLPRVNPFDLGDEAYAGDSQLHSLDRGQDEGWFLNTWLQASRLKGAHEQKWKRQITLWTPKGSGDLAAADHAESKVCPLSQRWKEQTSACHLV